MSWPEYNPVSDTPKYKLRFDRFDVCLIQTCRINDDIVARRKFPLHFSDVPGKVKPAGSRRHVTPKALDVPSLAICINELSCTGRIPPDWTRNQPGKLSPKADFSLAYGLVAHLASMRRVRRQSFQFSWRPLHGNYLRPPFLRDRCRDDGAGRVTGRTLSRMVRQVRTLCRVFLSELVKPLGCETRQLSQPPFIFGQFGKHFDPTLGKVAFGRHKPARRKGLQRRTDHRLNRGQVISIASGSAARLFLCRYTLNPSASISSSGSSMSMKSSKLSATLWKNSSKVALVSISPSQTSGLARVGSFW